MKVLQINATCGAGSTGKICVAISKLLTNKNIDNYILYSIGKSNYPLGIKYQGDSYTKIQALCSRLSGGYGFTAHCSTKKLIKELKRIRPDVVHLHNVHAHNCHFHLLLSYLKREKIKIFWTFHDCWTFTAYCPYFDMIGCDKWKIGCHHCPQSKQFSWFFDRSAKLYKKKKEALAGLDLTIITPSQWLADLTRESFLKDYPVKVINNGIDLSVFKPTKSDFRKKYCLEDKFVLLGVAFGWGKRKGLDVFIELAKRLDERYQIVLVGTDESVDKQLPENIISIHRTQNQTELAEIYSAADLFVNPTREENFPTVNIESLACGTPIITFKTGGSPEIIDESCGLVVEKDDIDGMQREIERICDNRPFSQMACLKRAQNFDMNDKFAEYIEIYTR